MCNGCKLLLFLKPLQLETMLETSCLFLADSQSRVTTLNFMWDSFSFPCLYNFFRCFYEQTMNIGHFIGVWIDTYVIYERVLEKKTYFGHCESLNFQMAPVASILNRFSQTRMHFKAENLLFPTMYNLWRSIMIYLWITNCLHSFRWVQIVIHR